MSKLAVALTLAVGVVSSASSRAQERHTSGGELADEPTATVVSLEEVLERASGAASVRGLARQESRLDAARGDVTALSDDLEVNLESGVQIVPVAAVQGRLGTMQRFSVSGLGDDRRAALAAERAATGHERSRRVLARRLEGVRAYARLWRAERTLELLREELSLAEEGERLARRGRELGELEVSEPLEASAYLEELRVALLDEEGARVHSEHEVTRVAELGARAVRTSGALPSVALPDAAERARLVSALGRDPEVVALASRALALRARAAEARTNNGVRLGLGAIADRQAPNGGAVMLAASLTLPTSGRGAREAAEFEAEAERAAGDADTARASRAVELDEVLHELDHTTLTRAQVGDRWTPALEARLATMERRRRAGEETLLEVLRARRATLAARLRAIAAEADEASARLVFRELVDGIRGEDS